MMLWIGVLSLVVAVHAQQAPALNRVDVKLFGAPCALEGPVDEDSLKRIHAMRPEQAYPDLEKGPMTSASVVERAIQKLKGDGKPLPAGLDRYREKLAARLAAQSAFLSARRVG